MKLNKILSIIGLSLVMSTPILAVETQGEAQVEYFKPTQSVELSKQFKHEGKSYQWLFTGDEFKLISLDEIWDYTNKGEDNYHKQIDEFIHLESSRSGDLIAVAYKVHDFESEECSCGYKNDIEIKKEKEVDKVQEVDDIDKVDETYQEFKEMFEIERREVTVNNEILYDVRYIGNLSKDEFWKIWKDMSKKDEYGKKLGAETREKNPTYTSALYFQYRGTKLGYVFAYPSNEYSPEGYELNSFVPNPFGIHDIN